MIVSTKQDGARITFAGSYENIFDPDTIRLRTLGMTLAIATLERERHALPHYDFGRASAKKSETRIVSEKRAAENADWVALIARVREKDRAAFAELFRHFAPRVKAFLMKGGASESLAEECMQDAMATLWTKAHLFDPSRASASTWVFTIARNRKIDALRKMRRPEPEDLTWGPEAEPDQADVIALRQESKKLTEAIKALPEKQRALIQQAYFGDLSHSEIAEATGLPLGTIKSRIRLALERLRHAMG